MTRLRCAVYTRKSTSEGLDQEFNSLDAQRDACEAYVRSQCHEGWMLLRDAYGDGGFSGGSMERPALQRLLADIAAGRIDIVVVYKVDRLTRSLADFAKIVERLDAKGVSFVSVTQSFNTTTSMGRLTLNVLLSFAQFEREVTAERIRDKIAASKKKGMWMGGPVPLGYRVENRRLLPEPGEARTVRNIMQRYLELGSVPALVERLRAEGVITKVQRRTSGPHRGGIPFARGSLYHLLKNPIYRGKIVHKGKVYPGEHEAIVDEGLWNAVQARLAETRGRRPAVNRKQNALLYGLLVDPYERPMATSRSAKGSRRYTYYQTRSDLLGPDVPKATRYPHHLLERHLLTHLDRFLADEHDLQQRSGEADATRLQVMFQNARALRKTLQGPSGVGEALRSLARSVAITGGGIELRLMPAAFGIEDMDDWLLAIPLPEHRPFREARLRIDAMEGEGASGKKPASDLLRLLGEAHVARQLLLDSPDLTITEVARREGRCRAHLARLVRLSWLSPTIVEAIVADDTPRALTRKRLLNTDLPVDWHEQQQLLLGA